MEILDVILDVMCFLYIYKYKILCLIYLFLSMLLFTSTYYFINLTLFDY